jgi:hypothetical protein
MKLLDLVGFDVLFLVIFSELVVKCVVGFRRFVREFWRTNGNGRKGHLYFSMFNRTGLYVGLKIIVCKSMGLLDFED